MHHFNSSGERSSLVVLIVATMLFAAGLAYEGTVLKPPQPAAQLALPDPNP
jgi:C4-dicarboxylate transporter